MKMENVHYISWFWIYCQSTVKNICRRINFTCHFFTVNLKFPEKLFLTVSLNRECQCPLPQLPLTIEVINHSWLNLLHCVKLSKYRVFSGPYFPAFRLNTDIYGVNLRIQPKCGKILTKKNSIFGHFSRSVQQDSCALKLQTLILDCFSSTFPLIPCLFICFGLGIIEYFQ